MSAARVIYGGDYNPEQWPEATWHEDVALMNEAGVDLVSLGVFSWARIQADEGEWDFAWLDRVLDVLHDGGIGVNLATATASIPPWAVRRYPDIVGVTEEGMPFSPGGRQHHAPTSPDYRRLARDLVTRLAERYAAHPAVRMWHIDNEFTGHVPWDYSIHATRAFREWLERRYGDIDGVNAAWNTNFWSQRLGRFDEIFAPRRTPASPNPAGLLDFRRFTSDAVLELYTTQRDIIRAAGATQPATTNFMGAFPGNDYWRWAQEVDVVANDCYPDPRDPESFREFAFAADLMRSLKPGVPWILMEQATNGLSWRPNNAQKRPGQMAAWSEAALARGAGGIMFFQWRQSVSGAERFHSAMVPHAGTQTRTWREISTLGRDLAQRTPVATTPAEVAIVLDWPNRWAIEQWNHPVIFDHIPLVRRWYDALHATHVQTDFVRATDDLSRYRVVVAPALYLLSDEAARAITAFVDGGGVLVTTPYSDIVDEQDRFKPGGYTTRLGPVFGGRVVDFDGILPEDGVVVDLDDAAAFGLEHMVEEFVLDGGEVVIGTTDGRPVLVRNEYGKGLSLHATAFTDEKGARAILELAFAHAGVRPVLAGLPREIEAVATAEGVVLVNQSRRPVPVATERLSRTLEPFEVVRLPGSAPQ